MALNRASCFTADSGTTRRCDEDMNGFRSSQAWTVTVAVVRAVLSASVLVALYYVLPLDLRGSGLSMFARIALGTVLFLGLMTWNVKAITQSDNPGLRALEGLMVVVPLFILLFASAYYLMSDADGTQFTDTLSRSDALYFTVTIFSTVGFGDISPQSEAARLVTSGQMILDLIILGLGIRIILEAVQRGRSRLADEPSSDPAAQ
jgi:voltage-gated potassium channel